VSQTVSAEALPGILAIGIPVKVCCPGSAGRGVGACLPMLVGQQSNYMSRPINLMRNGTRARAERVLMKDIAMCMPTPDIAAVSTVCTSLVPVRINGFNFGSPAKVVGQSRLGKFT